MGSFYALRGRPSSRFGHGFALQLLWSWLGVWPALVDSGYYMKFGAIPRPANHSLVFRPPLSSPSAAMSLSGRVALITGAASGLGHAAAKRIVQQGGAAVIVDLPSSNGEAVAKELGSQAAFAPADITSADDVRGLEAVTALNFRTLLVWFRRSRPPSRRLSPSMAL